MQHRMRLLFIRCRNAHTSGIQDQGTSASELEPACYQTIVIQLKSMGSCIRAGQMIMRVYRTERNKKF